MNIDQFINTYVKFPFIPLSENVKFLEDNTYNITLPRVSFDSYNSETQKLDAILHNDTYSFNLKSDKFDPKNENVIITCIRDNANLLDFLLSKLKKIADSNNCDILVVDDRSINEDVYNIANKYSVSYLRIDNNANLYSYSMINNIGVAYANSFGKKYCLFWNSDMWPKDAKTLKNLIKKHHKYKATLSGTRLIYPSQKQYEEIFDGYDHVLGDLSKIFGTIQHGGIVYKHFLNHDPVNSKRVFATPLRPIHQWRFYSSDYSLACIDTQATSVTGAYWMISTQDFIEAGGLNMSLPNTFQDMDFCLRLVTNNKSVFYIGSEFMYHAESILNKKFGNTEEGHLSDNLVYDYLWSSRIENVLGYRAIL